MRLCLCLCVQLEVQHFQLDDMCVDATFPEILRPCPLEPTPKFLSFHVIQSLVIKCPLLVFSIVVVARSNLPPN